MPAQTPRDRVMASCISARSNANTPRPEAALIYRALQISLIHNYKEAWYCDLSNITV